jgi:hypothetical protein
MNLINHIPHLRCPIVLPIPGRSILFFHNAVSFALG